MAVTIKQIAETCHVSRGTVDRVLNNRGKVKPEIEEEVRRVAADLGYRPNLAGKALAAKKKNYVIGIILISEGNEFFGDVLDGIYRAEEEIADYGIHLLIRTLKGYRVERQISAMKELKEKVQFLILHGINDKRIAKQIDEYQDAGIPVMTLNADVENSNRLCYTGCDFVKSGETAAGMLGLLTKGESLIGIATGSDKILGHNQRIHGFVQACVRKYPNMKVADIIETNDDNDTAYKETKSLLEKNPALTAIYIVAAGAEGVCRAVQETGREDTITVVASDNTGSVREWMKQGLIRAVICQRPWNQGYHAVITAMEYLIKDIVPEHDDIMKNDIYILENME